MAQFTQFITNHWQLFTGLIIVLLLIVINELLARKKRAREISPRIAVGMINEDKAVIIDLRDQESFRKGHIINAVNVAKDDIEQSKLDKYKDKTLVLVCAQGLQSPALAAKLKEHQFTDVIVLAGGMAAWQAADLPLVKGK
ncbi:rhodanese-like domain-containing protein [Legionella dresdenensis]|uniref:Rhodanese-like domain-containing protein n=1 Tax=Legionella dresdenensis TaxID=450200 RepID=A0ABV8CDM7_9GAMM